MADVFVSYARLDFKVAKALAGGLTSRGYQVWWDAELLGGDDFRQIILDELTTAKAAIVIWSANAVKSSFVQDEAARALKAGKLISTNVDGFDVKQLPLGFGGQHCHPVADFKSTEEALRKRGIKTEQAKPINEQGALRSEASVWAAIENSTDPEEFKPTQAQPNQAFVEYCADKRNSKISTFLGWFFAVIVMVSAPIVGLSSIISLFGGSLGYVYILTYKLQVIELSAIIFVISYCVLALFL